MNCCDINGDIVFFLYTCDSYLAAAARDCFTFLVSNKFSKKRGELLNARRCTKKDVKRNESEKEREVEEASDRET